MKKLIRKILREHKSDTYYRFLDKISSIIEKPYFRNMYEKTNGGFWDITDEDDQLYILKNIFGSDISINWIWEKVYDENRNHLYEESSDGFWRKWEYDGKGNMLYYEQSDGDWWKWEYDNDGNMVYYENSDGFWEKREYDDKGKKIYFENSYGYIIDRR
jgi:hypothetical protein